jgi:hypothetical protein
MATIGLLLEVWGIHVEATIDPEHVDATGEEEMAAPMDDMGFLLYDFCPIGWNHNIVESGSNDGINPYQSQEASEANPILGALNTMTSR